MLRLALNAILFAVLYVPVLAVGNEAEWGIDVTEGNAGCELRTPVEKSEKYGNLWLGFYVIADRSNVKQISVPKGEIVLIVRLSPLHSNRDHFVAPDGISINGTALSKYLFDTPSGTSFSFLPKSESAAALRAAISSGKIEITLSYADGDERNVTLVSKREAGLEIYSRMLEACASAIAG